MFRKGKPNIQALARRDDVEALVEAATFQDLMPDRGGGTVDVGAPVREEAILALGALHPEAGNGTVAQALADPSDRVRVAAVRVLYAREEAAPLARAIGWLPPGRGHARRLALQALGQLRQPDSAPALAAALVRAPGDEPVGDAEAALLDALIQGEDGSQGATDVIEELLAALAHDREVVGDRAEELLAELAPASIEGVIAELKCGRAPHRAASVLARIRDTRALTPLVEALEHRDHRVRAESAAALGELRDPAAVDALMRATRDPDYTVRAQAGWALDRIGTVAVVVGVAGLMKPMIEETITAALEARGAGAKPALPEGREPVRRDQLAKGEQPEKGAQRAKRGQRAKREQRAKRKRPSQGAQPANGPQRAGGAQPADAADAADVGRAGGPDPRALETESTRRLPRVVESLADAPAGHDAGAR